MTISVVQSAGMNDGFSGDFDTAVTVGNSVVLVVSGYNPGTVITTSDPLYNGAAVSGAVKLIEQQCVNTGNSYSSIWLLPDVSSSGTSVSVTTNSTTGPYVGLIAMEVSGLGTSPFLDVSSSNTGTGAGDQDSGTTAATSDAPELIIGTITQDGTAGTIPGSPWTTVTMPGNSADNTFGGYQIATASGVTYAYNAVNGDADWTAAIAAIAATSAPPAQTSRMFAAFGIV